MLTPSSICSIIVMVIAAMAVKANFQTLPPPRYDGFVYTTGHRVDSNPIVIEAFLDPVCPDSRDSWLPLKAAVDHYGHRVWLAIHLLPLPYHDYAFTASRAIHIANILDSKATFPLLEAFFKKQERFYNAQTMNMSKASVVKSIQKFSSKVVGSSYYSAIVAGFNNRQTDLKTRVSFKYSTSRGVYGTPTFYLNGFVVPDNVNTTDYSGWRSLIDPLIAAKDGL